MITEHTTRRMREADERLESFDPRPTDSQGDAVAALGLIVIGAALGTIAGIAGTLLWVMP